jgi:hypothetical protein
MLMARNRKSIEEQQASKPRWGRTGLENLSRRWRAADKRLLTGTSGEDCSWSSAPCSRALGKYANQLHRYHSQGLLLC